MRRVLSSAPRLGRRQAGANVWYSSGAINGWKRRQVAAGSSDPTGRAARRQGNADLRPVLPVGAGTAAQSAAKPRIAPFPHDAPLSPYPNRQSGAQARERRPPASSPGGGRHAAHSAVRIAPFPHDAPLSPYPNRQSGAQARERRPPVGTAPQRGERRSPVQATSRTRAVQPDGGPAPLRDGRRPSATAKKPVESPGGPVSDRHRRERETSTNNAGRWQFSRSKRGAPRSRGSAIPQTSAGSAGAPGGGSPTGIARERETSTNNAYPPPTSDRHRPKARNQHQQPRPPPTKPLSPCRRAAGSARRWEPGTTCDANQEAGDPSFSRRRNG